MTRYTKLEGKQRAPLKASDHFGEKNASAPSTDAVPSTVPVASTDEAATKKKVADDASPAPKLHVQAANASSEAATPTQLLKRVKLLRLKAKKAKTEEKRKAFLKEAKDVERQASALNGENGKATGSRSSDGKRKADSREAGMGVKRRRTEAGSDAPAPEGENPWKKMERGEHMILQIFLKRH